MPTPQELAWALGMQTPLPGQDGYSFGNAQQIPMAAPQNTYTGAIPTPPSNYVPMANSLPHDYYRMQGLLNLSDPNDQRLNRLLQAVYGQRGGRT